jgi:hypothetical protein
MITNIVMFFLGVLLAPVIRPLLRPVFVELVRAGVQTVDEVKRLSAQAREGIEDAVAEAEAEQAAKAKKAAAAQAPAPPPPPADQPPA